LSPQRTAVAVLATVFLFNLLGRGSGDTYAVFVLPLEREFGWTRSQLTSVYSMYLLVGAFIAPLAGTLFDRFGPRATYTAGLLCLSAAFWLAASLGNLWEFYLFVGVTIGVGVGLVGMVPASALLTRWYRVRLSTAIATRKFGGPRVATLYGTLYSANAIGAAFGSLLGGVLHDLTGGYRTGFALSLCAAAMAVAPFCTVPALRNFR